MTDVISLLEKLAIDASLRTTEDIEQFILSSSIDDSVKGALLDSNLDLLKESMQVRNKVFCGIMPAEDDEQEEKDDDNENDNDEGTEAKILVNS